MNSAFYLKLKFQPDSIGFNSSRNHVPKFSQEVLLSRNLCMKEEVNHLLSTVHGGAVVVEVCLYDEEISKKVNSAHIFYYVWLGKTTNLMDTIEIPHFNPPSASLSNIFEDNTIVSVRFYPTIPTAKDVALIPKGSLDWDVVQHHAGFIESNLLRSLSLITLDQELSISITPSIAAHFTISKIEYVEDRLAENKPDECTRNKRRTKKEVCKISNQTQLIIEPYVAEERNSQEINVSSNGKTIIKNSHEKQTTARAMSANRNWQNLNFQSVSEMVPLRILPQRFRYCNSFLPTPHPASSQPLQNNITVPSIKAQKSSIQTLIHDDDYLDSFLISSAGESCNDVIDSRKEENISSFPWTHNDHYTSESTQSKTTPSRFMKNAQMDIRNSSGKDPKGNENNLGSSALCDAFIHPLYLKTLLELKTSSSSLTNEDLLAFLNDTTYPFLAYVTRSMSSRPSPSGIADRSLVRVYCTEKILPFMISLPSIVERALGVGEYDFVTLILLLRHRPSAPASINLHPISWTQNSKSGKGGLMSSHLDSSKDVAKSSSLSGTELSPELFSTLSLNQVIDAFLRFIQKQSTSSSPFLFAHQSILTLSLPLTLSKNTSIPASKIPSSNLMFSTPTKSPPITSNANTPTKSIPSISTCNMDFLIEFTGINQIKVKGNMSSR